MRDWRLNGDVGLRRVMSSCLFTLHCCTIVAVATSDTAAHASHSAVLYQLTNGPSNDIPHKEVIALSLSARLLAAAGTWTVQQPWTLPMSSSLLNITVGDPIMLLRTMDRLRGHCSGMRYVVWQVSRWYIEAEIACSEYTGNVLFICGYCGTVTYGRRHAVYTASSVVPHPASVHRDNK